MDQCIGTKELCGGPKLWKAAFAEFIGTLFLTLVGCGTCLGEDNWENASTPTAVQISLAFGLIVATMVWCIAHVSGGHINPAVTVAMLVTRRISLIGAIVYILFQMFGAAMGATLLAGVTNRSTWGTLGRTSVDTAKLTVFQGFGVEFLITSILVLTVFASTDSKRKDIGGSIPLTIGLSVAVCHLFAIKYTGSSMNPARSFGPAIVLAIYPPHKWDNATSSYVTKDINGFENQWLYWIGPILGGIAAGLVYELVFAVNASKERTVAMFSKCPYDRDATSGRTDADNDGVAMAKV